MLRQFHLQTHRENFYNITAKAAYTVQQSRISDGICIVFCPHTTAGITINENADPDVVTDMLNGFSKAFPDRPEFQRGTPESQQRGQQCYCFGKRRPSASGYLAGNLFL